VKKHIIVLLILSIAFGDKLHLKNGEIIDGKYIDVDYSVNKLVFSVNYETKVLYKIQDIKYVTDDNGYRLWDYSDLAETPWDKKSCVGSYIIVIAAVLYLLINVLELPD
jgi:hypothetical protein